MISTYFVFFLEVNYSESGLTHFFICLGKLGTLLERGGGWTFFLRAP